MLRPLASSAGLVLIAAGTANANILVNGDFEVGNVLANGQAYTPAPWTSTAPGNAFINWDTWANTGGPAGLSPSFAGLFTGATAPSGNRWSGGFSFEEMGQLLGSPLTPGQQYNLSAFVRPSNPHPPASFEFWIGTGPGSPVTQIASFPMVTAGAWHAQSTSFIAPANSLANPWFLIKAYSIAADGTPQTVYAGIDDVYLDVVPTPGAAGLLGCAGLAAAWRRRR